MFTITAASSTRNVTVCGSMKKTQKSFKKFGKRLAKQRRDDLNLMGQRVKDIARDEERRARELAADHQAFIEALTPKLRKDGKDDDDVSFFDLDSE
jgi:UDP-N-acetylmuramyl pentapeptide synthase